MVVSSADQGGFFLWVMAAGALAAFVYDILRISRKKIRTRDIVVIIEDIIFFVIAALILYITAYLKNSGEIRWYGFIGYALGFLIYRLLIGDRFIALSVIIIDALLKVIIFILKIVLFPIALVYKILRRPFMFIAWHTGKGAKKVGMVARIRKDKLKKQLKNTGKLIRKK